MPVGVENSTQRRVFLALNVQRKSGNQCVTKLNRPLFSAGRRVKMRSVFLRTYSWWLPTRFCRALHFCTQTAVASHPCNGGSRLHSMGGSALLEMDGPRLPVWEHRPGGCGDLDRPCQSLSSKGDPIPDHGYCSSARVWVVARSLEECAALCCVAAHERIRARPNPDQGACRSRRYENPWNEQGPEIWWRRRSRG